LSGAVEDTRLLFLLTCLVANAPEMQSWNPGDEFESIRKRILKAE
jgi:hypothetical protein